MNLRHTPRRSRPRGNHLSLPGQQAARPVPRRRKPAGVLLLLVLLLAAGAGPARALQHLTCGQAWLKNMVRIGVLQDPKTLNIWLASDVWTRHVLRLVYSTLYVREPKNLELIPWLAAEDARYDHEKLTYTIKLRKARWSDGSEFTAEDVAFTAWLVKKFRVPRYSSKWRFVKKIEVLDKHTIRFTLKKPKAIFLTRTLATPIVQKKQWAPIAAQALKTKKPLATLLHFKMDNPVGTGPFVVKKRRSGTYLYMEPNPHFFARGMLIAGRRLGPYVKGIIFKVYGTSDAAILALRKGSIDMYLNGIQPGYLDQLRGDPHIRLFRSKKSAIYYFGFNLRRKPFSDRAFRRAVATLIDKDFIIKRVLQGMAIPMKSIVPPGNIFYYNENLTCYGQGLTRKERIRQAWRILKKAGYSWRKPPVDAEGRLDLPAEELRGPDGKPIRPFTILTPPADYDPNRAMAGMLIQEWLRQLGMPAEYRSMAFSALLRQVKYKHDFDCFVLGYGRLSLDPGYMRIFFHSKQDKRRGWNMSGYHNPYYDKISLRSDGAMDPVKRRELLLEMQRIISEDVPYFPLYCPILVEGARTDRFQGWVPMLEGIGNLWSFCEIKPVTR